MVIGFPQCGQVIVFVCCGANNSETDTPSAEAIRSSRGNDVFPLAARLSVISDTPNLSAKSF